MLKILFVFVSVYMHVIIYSYGYSCICDEERKHTVVCDIMIPSMKANYSYLPPRTFKRSLSLILAQFRCRTPIAVTATNPRNGLKPVVYVQEKKSKAYLLEVDPT